MVGGCGWPWWYMKMHSTISGDSSEVVAPHATDNENGRGRGIVCELEYTPWVRPSDPTVGWYR